MYGLWRLVEENWMLFFQSHVEYVALLVIFGGQGCKRKLVDGIQNRPGASIESVFCFSPCSSWQVDK